MFQTFKYFTYCFFIAFLCMRLSPEIQADDVKYAQQPFAAIAVAGLQRFEEDLNRLAIVSENEELLKKYQMLKNIIKTFPGIDNARPFGASIILQRDQLEMPAVLAFLPVTNGKSFMKSMQQRFRRVETMEEDRWQVKLPDLQLYVLLQNDYLLISQSEEVLEKTSVDLLSELKSRTSNNDIIAWIDFEGLSESNRNELLHNIYNDLAKEEVRKPDESDEEFRLRTELIGFIKNGIQHVVQDSQHIAAGLLIEDTITFQIDWLAKSESRLTRHFSELQSNQSDHAYPFHDDIPFQVQFNIALPKPLKPFLLDFLKVARDQIKNEIGPQLAAADRGPVSGVFNAIHKTVQKGQLNAVMGFEEAEENEMIFLSGLKITEDDLVAKFLRAILPYADDSDDVSEVELDLYQSEDLSLHRLRGTKQRDEDRRVYGDSADLYVGTSDASFWLANGGESTPVRIDKMNKRRGTAKQDALLRASFEFDPWLRLAEAHQQDVKKIKIIRQAIPSEDGDNISFEVKNVKDGLSASLLLDEGYFKLLGIAIREEQRKKQAKQEPNRTTDKVDGN